MNALFLVDDINLRKKQRGPLQDEIPERIILNTISNKSPVMRKKINLICVNSLLQIQTMLKKNITQKIKGHPKQKEKIFSHNLFHHFS